MLPQERLALDSQATRWRHVGIKRGRRDLQLSTKGILSQDVVYLAAAIADAPAGPGRSGGHCGQPGDGIIAQRRDGFQRHIAGSLNSPLVILFEQDRSDKARMAASSLLPELAFSRRQSAAGLRPAPLGKRIGITRR